MRKILLPILILLSFSAIVILPSSLNICLPDGCNFNNSDTACGDNSCANETIVSHLGERTQLLSATAGFQLSISFIVFAIVVAAAFFVIKKYSEDKKLIVAKSYFKQKLLNSSGVKLFNYLIEVFSRGILNSKIY